jgi:lipopolysaccharide transport system permease protein
LSTIYSSPLGGAQRLWHHRSLIWQMLERDVAGRYRGSVLGILWSLITPLFMLAVYTFVFGTVFNMRWTEQGTTTPEFAILLFAGLTVFSLFSEVVVRAPTLVLSNANYVKKIVFPLVTLPIVALGSALFHTAVSLVVLFLAIIIVMDGIPLTAVLLPLVLAPLMLFTLGLAWFLASLGVYFRDVTQMLGPIVMALMFLSPIFYPAAALPEWMRAYLFLNPLTLPIEQARDVLIWGRVPDLGALALYGVFAAAVAALGFLWFEKTRKGFADVL